MSRYTAGVMKTDNAVQAMSSCQILLLQASVFSRVIEKQGLLQHQKPKGCFWKSSKERQADVALLGCSEAGLGRSRGRAGSSRGYCNPQPCCGSETIAGLVQTLLTSGTRTGGLRCLSQKLQELHASRRLRGEFLCDKMHKTEIHIYVHPPDEIFILWHHALKETSKEFT